MVESAGDHRWSSFLAHGLGQTESLLDTIVECEALAKTPAVRGRRWSAYVHHEPTENELTNVRRSIQAGLPFGEAAWVARLSRRLGLDMTIRPRGRPRKTRPQERETPAHTPRCDSCGLHAWLDGPDAITERMGRQETHT
jgi:putative transposase